MDLSFQFRCTTASDAPALRVDVDGDTSKRFPLPSTIASAQQRHLEYRTESGVLDTVDEEAAGDANQPLLDGDEVSLERRKADAGGKSWCTKVRCETCVVS